MKKVLVGAEINNKLSERGMKGFRNEAQFQLKICNHREFEKSAERVDRFFNNFSLFQKS